MDGEYTLYQMVWIIGAVLGATWLLAYFIGLIGGSIWAWVDDGTTKSYSPLTYFIMTRLGYDMGYADYDCWSKKGKPDQDGSTQYLTILAIVIIAPVVLYTAYLLYTISLILGVLFIVAFVARLCRRQGKVMDKHILDKDAHK